LLLLQNTVANNVKVQTDLLRNRIECKFTDTDACMVNDWWIACQPAPSVYTVHTWYVQGYTSLQTLPISVLKNLVQICYLQNELHFQFVQLGKYCTVLPLQNVFSLIILHLVENTSARLYNEEHGLSRQNVAK